MEPSEFFDTLDPASTRPRRPGMTNSFLFEIEGAGTWRVDVADGKVSVSEGAGDADVTIRPRRRRSARSRAGEQNPTTAYMTGKLKVEGDMGAALKLQKLF